MNDDSNHELSQSGRQRKGQMLADLTPRVRRVARARQVRAGVLASAALIALASLSILIIPGGKPQTIAGIDPAQPVEPLPPIIQVVRTDPTVMVRLAVRTGESPSQIKRITDDELLLALAEMGRPTGMIHSQGRTWLTAKVTGDQRNPAATPAISPSSG